MTGIGVYSSRKSNKTSQDYILANRSVGYLATSLSAVSTCHSGFMFIGMIGFTYLYGISAMWLIIAWLIGDFFAWSFIYTPLREKTEQFKTVTIPGFISHHFSGRSKRSIQLLAGIFILLFLSVYAAAQLTAGSKALSVMLGWSFDTGIIIGAIIVLLYSFSGGIRASIWTDVVQSIIMLVSMIGLVSVALFKTNGLTGLFQKLTVINPDLVNIIPNNLEFGFPLYLAGWIAFGFGVIGQPHIIVRPMSIRHPNQIKKAMGLYLTWYTIFSFASIGVGLAARILLPDLAASDHELALPILATNLLPALFVGGILAGLFSATISTADSQILTCSASITQDLFPQWKQSFSMSKIATLITMILTVFIALSGSQNVYILVILAWSSLAVIFGPLILCKCYNISVSFLTTLSMIIIPFIAIIIWSYYLKLSSPINEVLPGFIVALIVFGISSKFKKFKENV